MTTTEPTTEPTANRSGADLVAEAHRLLDATETWQIGRVTVTKFVEMAVTPPEAIDVVVATHLHTDHVGWFTIRAEDGDGDGGEPRWVPTFPNARHLVVRDELAHWQAVPGDDARARPHLADSVAPVLEADLVDQVDADHAVTDEIRLLSTPGHSPGHVSVLITSDGASAVITGDLLHHPIQALEPGWDGPFDEDTTASAATRKAFLARFADTDTLVLGTHVATPTAGRIVTTPNGWRWDAAPS